VLSKFTKAALPLASASTSTSSEPESSTAEPAVQVEEAVTKTFKDLVYLSCSL
jgi:hypothetical protein